MIKLLDVPAEVRHRSESVPRPSAALLHVSGSAPGNAHPSHRLQPAASSTEDKKNTKSFRKSSVMKFEHH